MASGRARLAIGQGLSVWVLEAPGGFGDARFHAHHAIQVTVSLAGSLSLHTADRTLTGPAVAVAPDARHRFEAEGLLAFLFVEPEGTAGKAMASRLFADSSLAALDYSPLRGALAPLGATFAAGLGRPELLRCGQTAIDVLVPSAAPACTDPRVERLIAFAQGNLDRPISLADAAREIALSPTRLSHLFVEQTGLPFRTYLVWLRLVRALDLYSEGASLTEAAHEAGFSDSAHFSRIFRRTFGASATTLRRV